MYDFKQYFHVAVRLQDVTMCTINSHTAQADQRSTCEVMMTLAADDLHLMIAECLMRPHKGLLIAVVIENELLTWHQPAAAGTALNTWQQVSEWG